MRNYFQKLKKENRGVATLEILMAMLIIIVAISAVILLVFGGQSATVSSQTSQEALYKAQTQIENARAQARADFSAVAGLACDDSTATKCTGTPSSFYNRKVTVTADPTDPTNDYKKLVTSQVTWGSGFKSILSTIVTDWQGAANSCSSTLTGDWSNPKVINTSTIDIDASSSVTDVTTINGYAFITGDAPSSSKNDFYIVDVSNPVTPILEPNPVDTGPGLNALSVNGNYAYVANASTTAQLQVIDITSKTAPFLYKSFKLPTTDSDQATATVGYSILYKNGKVYMGTKKNGKAGFHIIDVSNLSNINEVGYKEVNNTINRIQVAGNYAYLASDDSTQELRVFNISTPSSIGDTSFYNPNNATGGFGNSVTISGNSLFLGRTFDSGPTDKELEVVNITDPTTKPLPALMTGQKISDSVNGLVVKGSLVLLSTNSQFQVRKTSDLSLYGSLALSSSSPSMNCTGNYVYVGVLGSMGSSNKDVLKIIGPGLSAQATLVAVATPSTVVYGNTSTLSTTGGSGTGAVTYSAGGTGGCSVSGSTLSVVNASLTCTVTATKAGDSSYSSTTSAAITVTLQKASQASLTVTSLPASAVYQQSGITAVATGGSGTGAVTFSAGASTACTVNAATGAVTITSGSGTCSITATKALDNNYIAITSAPATITTISKANQTITFTAPPNKNFGDPDFALSATASSGLVVSFTSTTPTICSTIGANGSTAHIIAVGTCNITASQSGNANYNSAPTVVQSFIISTAFTYSVSNPGVKDVIRGTPLNIIITATKLAGNAAPVQISINPIPSNVSLSSTTPATATCTPNPTCTVTFTFNASSSASKSSSSVVSGTPLPVANQTFTFTSN